MYSRSGLSAHPPEVDGERISITGTSGGGTQAALIAALDNALKWRAFVLYQRTADEGF